LASNRALCVKGDSSEFITLPIGYEQKYAILTSQILAYMKANGLEGAKATMSRTQTEEIAKLTARATDWDISHVLHPRMFPDRSTVPYPDIHVTVRPDISVTGVEGDGSYFSEAFCRADGLHFKRIYAASYTRPFKNVNQHCCARGCVAYVEMSRVSGSSMALDTCCQDCNKYDCVLQGKRPPAC
jgi:hypothetical protein